MTWKSYAAVSGAGVLATYMMSAPPTLAPVRDAGPSRPAAVTTADIQEEAARLESRMRAETAFRAPSRNPFRFGAVPRAARAVAPPIELPPPPAGPEPPFIKLSGIAADVVDGRTVRTAILTTIDGVLLVRAGDPVVDGYRVRSITEDSIELESPQGEPVLRLRLTP